MTLLIANWRIILVIALFATYSAFVYRIGGNSPRAELKAVHVAAEAFKQESARIAKEKDREYEKDIARVKSDWADWMRRHSGKVRNINARVCESDEANRELSDAVSAYVGEVERFRTGAEGLLAEADGQRERVDCAVEWAQTLNR